MDNYVAYHVHSDYSLLDSTTDFNLYIEKAKQLGQKAICFTEHGNTRGWVAKKMACDAAGIKYLHGVERNFNSGHDNHNEKLDAWLKEPGREHLIVTRGSDCHEIPQVGLVDFVVDEDVRDSRELAEVLRKLA